MVYLKDQTFLKMNFYTYPILLFVLLFASCTQNIKDPAATSDVVNTTGETSDQFTIVFASCNDQDRPQPLWKPILQQKPDAFIWGGDNIYADTDSIQKMIADYKKVTDNPNYANLAATTKIYGTWDDHDYGKNDAGAAWFLKEEAKTALLDFLNVPLGAEVRKRAGVYQSNLLQTQKGSVKMILLDTRSFRTPLKESPKEDWRYEAWTEADGGTILGETQWNWFKEELKDTRADFTIIITSIQFLSDNHGWEKWGNHPAEVKKMYATLRNAKAKNILLLSGDRHLAEIAVNYNSGLDYPLVDFTASGLTHTWIDSATEANAYRVSNVIKHLNFGVLRFDFENKRVTFQIRGKDNFLFEEFTQQY